MVVGESGEVGNPGTLGDDKGEDGVSIGDRLHGSQVSKARPGAPFDCCRRSEGIFHLLGRGPMTTQVLMTKGDREAWLAILVVGSREGSWRARQVRASVVEKLRTARVRQAASGSFDSAPPSAVSRHKSVRRSAQDDVFVGVLKNKSH